MRIHSSSNLVHEFQTSLTTEELLASEGRSGSDDDEDEEDTPQSGGRSGRRRARHSARKPSPISFSLLSLLVGGSPRRGRRGSGGRRRSSRGASAAWLGLAFTLCWMGASSALIFGALGDEVLPMRMRWLQPPCCTRSAPVLFSPRRAFFASILSLSPPCRAQPTRR